MWVGGLRRQVDNISKRLFSMQRFFIPGADTVAMQKSTWRIKENNNNSIMVNYQKNRQGPNLSPGH